MNASMWVVLGCIVCGQSAPEGDGAVLKEVLRADAGLGPNLLTADRWGRFEQGFEQAGEAIVCDNAGNPQARRVASQTVLLNQTRPMPIVATVESRAEGVSGSRDSDYALYLDLVYQDGTPLWGQTAAFAPGTHDFEPGRVIVVPERPVKSVTVNLLLRNHAGRAEFRAPRLSVLTGPEGGYTFDTLAVVPRGGSAEGFQVRDVAADGPFVRIDKKALGLALKTERVAKDEATYFDVTLEDTTGKDRAVTLLYALPVAPANRQWLEDPRTTTRVEPGREYSRTSRFEAGANGRLSLYPMGAVRDGQSGVALGIDPFHPAFFRVAYNAAAGELFLAYDVALTAEKPSAHLRFVKFEFEPEWGFRGALARYMELYPEAFRVRVKRQGQWMPFAAISKVRGWEDFGFVFKEGNDETAWDDAHDIVTFRYTEPLTWWMPMAKDLPRTMEAALGEAKRLAAAGKAEAQALFTSGYHDASGEIPAQLLDTPWNNGAVWSMNSMPGLAGEPTDFGLKWNAKLRETLYGGGRQGVLDGEYVDSSEGYVTAELDFNRAHFAPAHHPLVFDTNTKRPALFRGLIAWEYVRGIERDVHEMNRLMMANATPGRLCWLAPLLDVMGTETDWNPGGRWQPMSDGELLYRRALCGAKPFCFLMNTDFDRLSPDRVEAYMRRALAYGMFPGFFSHNASERHYFSRPELYDRDRPLFRKYVPLCRLVAEAGWQPVTRARASDERIRVERFGTNTGSSHYYTLLNEGTERIRFTLRLEAGEARDVRELVEGRKVEIVDGQTLRLELDAQDVAVIEVKD